MASEEKPASGVRSGRMNVGRHLNTNFRVNPAALAYAMTTLGSAMINNIFTFYYVKLFINKYKISEGAFHQSQVSILFRCIAVHVPKCILICVKSTGVVQNKSEIDYFHY